MSHDSKKSILSYLNAKFTNIKGFVNKPSRKTVEIFNINNK